MQPGHLQFGSTDKVMPQNPGICFSLNGRLQLRLQMVHGSHEMVCTVGIAQLFVATGDRLLSLFCSLPQKLCAYLQKQRTGS
jgi:hypothetical protein